MIIEVTRELGEFTYAVAPLADDGSPLVSRGNAVLGSRCAHGALWGEVGRLTVAHGGGDRGDTGEVTIRYADRNSLIERIRHSRETQGV